MDGSDKEIIKDDLPVEKQERNEKHSEIDNEKTCDENELMHYTPVNSSVKRKSEQCSENQRKRSTDNVQKESDENSRDCANMQDTDLSASNSKKYGKQLSPVTLSYNSKESKKEHSNQADQSTAKEENIKSSEECHSATQEIKASIMKYFSSSNDLLESDSVKTLHLEKTVCEISNNIIKMLKNIKENGIVNQQNVTSDTPTYENIIDSKRLEIYIFSDDDTQIIDENLLGNEQVEDNKISTLVVSESTCTKCKQERLLTPIISPGKRKSDEIVEDEIKRKRSADNASIEVRNDKNLTDSLNAQDSEVYASHSKKSEKKFVNTVVSIDDTAEGCVKEQCIAINQTDQSHIQYKITETTGETDDTHELQKSNNQSTPDQTQNSDKVLLLADSNVSSTVNRSVSLVVSSFFSSVSDNVTAGGIISLPNVITNESTSKDRLTDSKNEDITENLLKFEDVQENFESDFPTKVEKKLVTFPSKMNNADTKVSCDIPLEISQNSLNANKSEESNISKSGKDASSEVSLPLHGVIGGHLRRRVSRFSPVKLFSDSEYDLNPVYNEPPINLDHMENDPEFIENQKQILESLSHQRQQISRMKPEPVDEGKFPKSGKSKDAAFIEIQKIILESISHQQQQISSVKPESDDEGKFRKPLINRGPIDVDSEIPIEVRSKIYKLFEMVYYILESEGKNEDHIDELTFTFRLIEVAVNNDPVCLQYIPYIMHKIRELSDVRSSKEFLENNDGAQSPVAFVDGSPDTLPRIVNLISPISSPPKNEPDDKISETDSPELREYPGLAEDLTSVKKDARYQKKFYKRKNPVILPINWKGDKASSCKQEPNIHSEGNKIQTNDDLGIVWRNCEDDVHGEKIREDTNIILKNKDPLKEKEKSEDTLSTEEPMKVSEDTKILLKDKDMFIEEGKSPEDKLSGTSASTSEDKISSSMEESPNSSQSNFPIKNESKLPTMLEIIPQNDELAAQSMSISSKNHSSVAEPPQSPSSDAEPPQSPSSVSGASQTHMG